MQITITLNSEEELMAFMDKYLAPAAAPAPAAPAPVKAAPAAPAQAPAAPTPVPVAPAPAPVAPAPAPVKKVTYQDLQAKAIALMDQGKQEQLKALLQRYNVPALPSLTEEQYWGFMADMEAM